MEMYETPLGMGLSAGPRQAVTEVWRALGESKITFAYFHEHHLMGWGGYAHIEELVARA